MQSEHGFSQEGAEDFTNDFTASPDQDYITLFMYHKGHDYDPITVGKNAAKTIVKLFPYNFTAQTYRTHLTVTEKIYSEARVLPRQTHPLRT